MKQGTLPLIRKIWSRLNTKDSHIASSWSKPPCKIVFIVTELFWIKLITELTKFCQLASRKEGQSLRTEIHVLTWKYNGNLRTEKPHPLLESRKSASPREAGRVRWGSVSISPSALQPSGCPPSDRASSVAAMCAAATALVFRNHRMRQWPLFIVANIVYKGEVWGYPLSDKSAM